ncbi:hypothetical protein HanIR_Chr04g0158571 [Helianthus annuus]|nr:hypothetical protein HanIR_Chr04g0158571 [Helianthus annuus]
MERTGCIGPSVDTVSDDLLKRLMDTTVARAAWTKLEKIFLSNKKARVAALETRFCNLTLTACSSVDDYCQQLSDLASQLTLISLLPSHDSFFSWFVASRPNTIPLDQAIVMLNDEVIRIDAQKGSQNTVLAATTAPPTGGSSNNQNQPSEQPYSSTTRRGSRGRGGNSNRRGRGRSQQSSPWTSYQGQPTPYPNWAWWTPPPCPYPTQQQWTANKQSDQQSAPSV